MTTSKKTTFDISENIISCDASYRGGTLKVDVSELFPSVDNPVMGAYQNYLGGGMRGAIVGGAMFDPDELANDNERELFHEVAESIKKYFHDITNDEEDGMNDEWNTMDYEKNQNMPVSGY